jgi:hypothetical protein
MSPLRLTLVALLVASTALFGVDTESTPLIVLAVFVGLALAAAATAGLLAAQARHPDVGRAGTMPA